MNDKRRSFWKRAWKDQSLDTVKMGKVRGRKGGGSTALPGLIESIKEHKGFKGLLSYSVNCIVPLVTPPNPNIVENVDTIIEMGGIEALVEA